MNKEIAIHKLELLIEDLKTNQEEEKESGKSYFNTNLFAIRISEILKILKEKTQPVSLEEFEEYVIGDNEELWED